MKKELRSIILAMALVALLALGLSACGAGGNGGNDTAGTPDALENPITVTMSFTLADDMRDLDECAGFEDQTYDVVVEEGTTLLDAIKQLGREQNFVVATRSSGGIECVTNIFGISQGDSTGWVYTHNGEGVMVGPSDITVADGDSFEWKFLDWTTAEFEM